MSKNDNIQYVNDGCFVSIPTDNLSHLTDHNVGADPDFGRELFEAEADSFSGYDQSEPDTSSPFFKEFLAKARKVHGERFQYDASSYGNARSVMTIVCPDHGPFLQRPSDHLNSKYGCRQCSVEAQKQTGLPEQFGVAGRDKSRFLAEFDSSYSPTYSELCALYLATFKDDTAHRNKERLSVIEKWVSFNSKSMTDAVGDELTDTFEVQLSQFASMFRKSGVSVKTARNRCYFIKSFQAHYAANKVATNPAMPDDFRGRLAWLLNERGLRPADLVKEGFRSVKDWIREGGSYPQKQKYQKVRALEEFLEVLPGTLLDLLPKKMTPLKELKTDLTRRKYSKKLSHEYPFLLKKLPSHLNEVWQKIVRHKKSSSLFGPCPKTGKKVSLVVEDYWASSRTVENHLEFLRRFFGYLALPKHDDWENLDNVADRDTKLRHGKYGYSESDMVFAFLFDDDILTDYLAYSYFRGAANSYSQQDFQFLNFVCNLISPHSGNTAFFRIDTSRSALLGLPEKDFSQWLDTKYEYISSGLRWSIEKQIKPRNLKEDSVGELLAEADLMQYLYQVPQKILAATMPFEVNPWIHSIAQRDVLMFELLMYLPLRPNEMAKLELNASLTKDAEGLWSAYLPKQVLKNGKYAHVEDIRVTYPEDISEKITAYVSTYRPAIAGGKVIPTQSLFIAGNSTKPAIGLKADEVSRRFGELFNKCFGVAVGGHIARTFVATDYLKKFPGDYLGAATLLNNAEDTVKKSYDKTTRKDAARRASEHVSKRHAALKGKAAT